MCCDNRKQKLSLILLECGVELFVQPCSSLFIKEKYCIDMYVFLLQFVKVLEYDRKIINDDRVKIRVLAAMEPHPMSPYGDEDFGYQTIKNSIRQIWTNATVVPGTYIANTIRDGGTTLSIFLKNFPFFLYFTCTCYFFRGGGGGGVFFFPVF